MRKGKRPKRKQNHPPRPPDPPPDHRYEIRSQGRAWERRGGERFWVAKGPVYRYLTLYPSRRLARQGIRDHIANAERDNPFSGYEFYWVARVDTRHENTGRTA